MSSMGVDGDGLGACTHPPITGSKTRGAKLGFLVTHPWNLNQGNRALEKDSDSSKSQVLPLPGPELPDSV